MSVVSGLWSTISPQGVRRGSFELAPVNRLFVLDQLRGLKVGKSTGLDGIETRFLRDGALLLAEPLRHIVNWSITSEIKPSLMKEGDPAL